MDMKKLRWKELKININHWMTTQSSIKQSSNIINLRPLHIHPYMHLYMDQSSQYCSMVFLRDHLHLRGGIMYTINVWWQKVCGWNSPTFLSFRVITAVSPCNQACQAYFHLKFGLRKIRNSPNQFKMYFSGSSGVTEASTGWTPHSRLPLKNWRLL